MRPFTFNPGPRLISGDGQRQLADVLPAGPCLFVTDKDVLRLGLTDACRAALEEGGREIILFDAVEADPSKETLLAAVELGRRHDVTHVVGFGGGSPMDVAKLAAYLLGSGDDLDEVWGVESPRASGCRWRWCRRPRAPAARPPISVITCEGGTSWPSTQPLIADWAVLDASLTLGCRPMSPPRPDRRHRPFGRGLHVRAAQEPFVGRAGARGAAAAAGNLIKAIEEPRNVEARSAMLLARISPASPSPTRRSPAFMRWPIRWAASTTCRTASATR